MRYIVGIDLGTTNSCVCYIDIQQSIHTLHQFQIPQLKEEGYVEAQTTLPSFCYLASPHEWSMGSLNLPWKSRSDFFVGAFALSHGGKVPTRLVQSAKSWLCHPAAHRRDKILPIEAADESMRISPVEASARYLSHIKEAWNDAMASGNPELELQLQDIILTVPASFDEVARELTADAARAAGFAHLTLLEEPQAAFYSWIARHEKNWGKLLTAGSNILVCDVGGGTTDFSMMEVIEKGEGLAFQRMAVGDHLLLGGDNMDAAIAHFIEKKGQTECTSLQWLQLKHETRKAKEFLLSDKNEDVYRIVIQGKGSGVIQGSYALEIHKKELLDLLERGFFGYLPWEEALRLRKGSAIRTMGLPYEEEPSIVKHLAVFLHSCGKQPDFVLFNGGAMKPIAFQKAILGALKNWFPEKNPKILESGHLDLSVSRGAAYYGKVRRGEGVRIGGGAARGYYLGVDVQGEEKALTLLPRGAEEGTTFEPEQTFWLVPNTPVNFKLYSSHVRLHDKAGSFLNIVPEEMHLLPPIQTLLRVGKGSSLEKIPVHIGITLTPIGTLELWLKAVKTPHRWSLEFQLRTAEGQENLLSQVRKDETYETTFLENSKEAIRALFLGQIKPNKIMERLEESLGKPKNAWPPSLLRGLWEEVDAQAPKRKKSQELEARWWNLTGYLLRPGIGYPLDDYRMKELWKVILSDLKANRPLEVQIQSWICYRRVAGGLSRGQQIQLAHELWPSLMNTKIKNKSELYPYQERLRALASLELIDNQLKTKLGYLILDRISKEGATAAELWSLARLGARHLIHGGIAHVMPLHLVIPWIEILLKMKWDDPEQIHFVFGQLARKTEQREVNLPQAILEKITDNFPDESLKKLLFEPHHLSQSEQEKIYGESLPLGIYIKV